MKSINDTLLYHILVDEEFIHYVNEPTAVLIHKWEHYMEQHPEHIPTINVPRGIISGENITTKMTDQEKSELESQIIHRCCIGCCN